jgi:hypothetical protein
LSYGVDDTLSPLQNSGGMLILATAVLKFAQLMPFAICPIPQIELAN